VIHVYGVIDATAELPEGLRGLGASPSSVRTIARGDLAVVVSDLEEPPRTREDLERHAQVQSAIVAHTTLVPLQFGTLLDDEEEVRDGLLGAHAAQLREVVASVAGHVQMTVKAVYDEGVLLREVVTERPELKREADRIEAQADPAATREARIALGERIAQEVEARRSADEDHIVQSLARSADEIVVEPPTHERMAARLQLLVARERRPELDRAVEKLSAEQAGRMTLRYVGPMAPYSFCDLTLESEAGAWG
jgi:hypothetical protein